MTGWGPRPPLQTPPRAPPDPPILFKRARGIVGMTSSVSKIRAKARVRAPANPLFYKYMFCFCKMVVWPALLSTSSPALVLPCHALPCQALPCHALPCLALLSPPLIFWNPIYVVVSQAKVWNRIAKPSFGICSFWICQAEFWNPIPFLVSNLFCGGLHPCRTTTREVDLRPGQIIIIIIIIIRMMIIIILIYRIVCGLWLRWPASQQNHHNESGLGARAKIRIITIITNILHIILRMKPGNMGLNSGILIQIWPGTWPPS